MACTWKCRMTLPLIVGLAITGGQSSSPWVRTRVDLAFDEIHMVTKCHGWAIVSGGVFRTLDGGVTWWPVTPPGVKKVSNSSAGWFFMDATTAWLLVDGEHAAGAKASDGVLFSTTDGGRHWSWSEVPFASARLFIGRDEKRTIWALKRYGPASGSEPVELYRMENDGAWTLLHRGQGPPDPTHRKDSLPFGGLTKAVGFLPDGKTGWVTVEYRGQDQLGFYMTTDGGRTWRAPNLPIPPHLEGSIIEVLPPRFSGEAVAESGILPVIFRSVREGGQYGEFTAVFFVTESGGVSWRAASLLRAKGHRPLIAVADAANWWVLADSFAESKLYAAHDAGATWVEVGTVREALQIQFVTPADGWALSGENGQSVLLRTIDGGRNWLRVPVRRKAVRSLQLH
ncbi:MAG: WD40/YVTN/BNR-like repeat-containing protein [Ignavibacteriales bacterium]